MCDPSTPFAPTRHLARNGDKEDAFERYADPLKRVLACVTTCHLRRRYIDGDKTELQEFFLVNSPTTFAGSNLILDFSQYFHVVKSKEMGKFVVKTEAYVYSILTADTEKELFAFHWEPHSKVKFPHVHLGFGAKGHGLPIDNRAHIPSGRVAVEDVVTFLIADLGIKPLKDDWEDVIARERVQFMKNKNW
jgi:hypothetical protein